MTPDELKRVAVQKLIDAKRHNREQFYKFFTELYKVEQDPYAPIKVSQAFPGIDIPDVTKPGQTLEEKWPYFFVCKTDPKDPTFADYQPDSEKYKADFNALVALTKRIRARADEINAEARRLCESQSQGAS